MKYFYRVLNYFGYGSTLRVKDSYISQSVDSVLDCLKMARQHLKCSKQSLVLNNYQELTIYEIDDVNIKCSIYDFYFDKSVVLLKSLNSDLDKIRMYNDAADLLVERGW